MNDEEVEEDEGRKSTMAKRRKGNGRKRTKTMARWRKRNGRKR